MTSRVAPAVDSYPDASAPRHHSVQPSTWSHITRSANEDAERWRNLRAAEGSVTQDHQLGHGSKVAVTMPHRQIRHGDAFAHAHKTKGQKIQDKTQQRSLDPDGHPHEHGHAQQAGYNDDCENLSNASSVSSASEKSSGGHLFSHMDSSARKAALDKNDNGQESRQLGMYTTESCMSELSYERGYRDHEKQDGYNTYGYGYQGGVFRPDAETEAKIVSKLDRNLLPLLGILYLFSYLDRVNIGNARLFGLEEDVKLSNGEYNIALAAFFLSYCIFEMPSNMILIRVGPRLWIPVIMFAWGTVSLGLAWITSFKGLVIMRFALGAAEAGFVPGVLFYLTLFYKRSEHSFRMAIFLCFNILAGAFGGLLAAGISHLQGKWGLQRWQWIFVLEAIPTILLAFLTWFIMSPSPEEARFLTPEERSYAANRVLADTDIRPSPESSWKQTVAALTDVHVYLICLCTFFLHAASSGVIMFMPSLILDMGFKATTAQLLTTPPYIVAAGVSLFIPWWSDRLQVRGLFVIFVPVIAFLGFILLALVPWIWRKCFFPFNVLHASQSLQYCGKQRLIQQRFIFLQSNT